MINVEKVKDLYVQDPKMMAYLVGRKYGEYSNGYFDIFKTINNLDIRIALADYGVDEKGEPIECCQFVPRGNDKRGYIVLSNNSSIGRLRYNCAIILYCAIKNQKNIATYRPGLNDKTLRAAKAFAAEILIPEKELKQFLFMKDNQGKYLLLDENGEITIDDINKVARYFGAPYRVCASRILELYNNIKDIKSDSQLNRIIKSRLWSDENNKSLRKRECMMNEQLINSLRYLRVEKTKSITLEKILRECVKNEALLEGVIKDTKGVNYLLQVFANGGVVDSEGYLHNKYTKDKIKLSEDQLIVLGNYELLKSIALESSAYYTDDDREVVSESINKAGYGLSKTKIKDNLMDIGLKFLNDTITYKEAATLLKETCDMQSYEIDSFLNNLLGFDHYTLKRFHKSLFKYSSQSDYMRGKYRTVPVKISGAKFDTAGTKEIDYAMENLNYDIMDLLKIKDELTNSEYINKVNALVARFIMIHPFQDGNGRVSRALTNFLYKKKHLPFIFINADNSRNEYIDALSEINFEDIKYHNYDTDLTDINLIMYKALKTSYSNIYDGRKMMTDPEKEISRSRLTNPRKQK